jgi:hypothetical protein
MTMPGIFLYLLMIAQGPDRVVLLLGSSEFCLLIFNAGLKLILDILGSSFWCHIFLPY